jgi:WXG100 family type VII secretion target
VHGILEATGLISILQEVTGKPEALAQAADVWLGQAHQTKAVADELRQSARPLPQAWQGQASAAFGQHLGQFVNALDSMAGDMGTAAQILSQAAQECQVAEDLVNEIIREAIEFAVATLAATAVADIFTFGLATIAGGIAEGAEMTVFVARAAQVSTKLAEVLEKLLGTLKDLKALKEARGHLEGVQSVPADQGDLSGGEGAQGGRRRAVGHESGTALRHRSGQERRSSTGTGPRDCS